MKIHAIALIKVLSSSLAVAQGVPPPPAPQPLSLAWEGNSREFSQGIATKFAKSGVERTNTTRWIIEAREQGGSSSKWSSARTSSL
jgi:hypothetical protein